jgi:signal transduction histidine kinase
LLLLAKAESGKLQLTLAPVEFDSLLFEVMSEMRVLSGDKVTLKLTNVDQVLIIGDRDRLKQVLINLISNAIQYTPRGGEVALNMGKTSEQAWFSVKDTGPGIPKDDIPFIFDRFYRGEKSRTRSKATGFGLGLSIAYWIVSNHGGHIEVESELGKGTTFTLWLPSQETGPLPALNSEND